MPTTHRLKSWCCKAKTSHHSSLSPHTRVRTHFYSLAHIITSNLPSTLWLAKIWWGIFGCATCSEIQRETCIARLFCSDNEAKVAAFLIVTLMEVPNYLMLKRRSCTSTNSHEHTRKRLQRLAQKTQLINAPVTFSKLSKSLRTLKKKKATEKGGGNRGCREKKTIKHTG